MGDGPNGPAVHTGAMAETADANGRGPFSTNEAVVRRLVDVRWEYTTVELKTSRAWSSVKHEAVRAELNEPGAAGWELVSVFGTNDRLGRTTPRDLWSVITSHRVVLFWSTSGIVASGGRPLPDGYSAWND